MIARTVYRGLLIERQDAPSKCGQDGAVEPTSKNRSLPLVSSLHSQNPNFQFQQTDTRNKHRLDGDSGRPVDEPAVFNRSMTTAKLGNHVGIQNELFHSE